MQVRHPGSRERELPFSATSLLSPPIDKPLRIPSPLLQLEASGVGERMLGKVHGNQVIPHALRHNHAS